MRTLLMRPFLTHRVYVVWDWLLLAVAQCCCPPHILSSPCLVSQSSRAVPGVYHVGTGNHPLVLCKGSSCSNHFAALQLLIFLFRFIFLFYVCAMQGKSASNLWNTDIFLYYVGAEDHTKAVRLVNKHRYLLSHPWALVIFFSALLFGGLFLKQRLTLCRLTLNSWPSCPQLTTHWDKRFQTLFIQQPGT